MRCLILHSMNLSSSFSSYFLSGLVSFSQWIHLEAKDHDLEFVQTVIYFSTQILNRSSCSSSASEFRRLAAGGKRSNSVSSSVATAAPCTNATATARSMQQLQKQQQQQQQPQMFHLHPKKLTQVS